MAVPSALFGDFAGTLGRSDFQSAFIVGSGLSTARHALTILRSPGALSGSAQVLLQCSRSRGGFPGPGRCVARKRSQAVLWLTVD
jgi:hypothetical protein